MKIGALQKTSLIDYPNLISAVVFTQGCNFRCGYCHNPELLDPKNWGTPIPPEEILDFLENRRGKLDALVVTGGEPTLHLGLPDFLARVKELGFKVKLDSNGTNPAMLRELFEHNLVDYLAMDIKAPLDKYSIVAEVDVITSHIKESTSLIMQKAPDYEFRTTLVEGQLSYADILQMGREIKGAKKYFLQKFIPSKTNLPEFMERQSFSQETLEDMAQDLLEFVDFVGIR